VSSSSSAKVSSGHDGRCAEPPQQEREDEHAAAAIGTSRTWRRGRPAYRHTVAQYGVDALEVGCELRQRVRARGARGCVRALGVGRVAAVDAQQGSLVETRHDGSFSAVRSVCTARNRWRVTVPSRRPSSAATSAVERPSI
jgi:hypothetical protein